MKFLSSIIFLLLVLMAAGLARAQLLPDVLSLVATPESPSANGTVFIKANTPTFDKNSASFDWTVDGTPRPDLSGLGKDSISLKAGEVGSALRVAVDISRPDGGGASGSIIIRVSDLALTWFAQTYVPRWYKGKALPVPNSIVNVVAVPKLVLGGRTLRAEDLIYRWDFDDEENVLSGPGKQLISIKTSEVRQTTHRIRVVVEDIEGQVRKEGSLFIIPTSPRVALYSVSPLGGAEIRNALRLYLPPKLGLIDFQAEPFFFPVILKSALTYNWSIAGRAVQGAAENTSLLTIDTGKNPLGVVDVSLTVDDRNDATPLASGVLSLFFQ